MNPAFLIFANTVLLTRLFVLFKDDVVTARPWVIKTAVELAALLALYQFSAGACGIAIIVVVANLMAWRWEIKGRRKKNLGRVLIGMDTRESGPWIAAELASGLAAKGIRSRFAGVVTTPGVAYLTRSDQFAAGVFVAAVIYWTIWVMLGVTFHVKASCTLKPWSAYALSYCVAKASILTFGPKRPRTFARSASLTVTSSFAAWTSRFRSSAAPTHSSTRSRRSSGAPGAC